MTAARRHEVDAGRPREARPWWREDLVVIVGIFATILIASQFADGTTRPEVMLGTALVLGVVVRATRVGWRRARAARRRDVS